eukprot:CAMPEP_0117576140 /NCGR_PEP_ID=MMETSP0784-20121206/62629_1 /TAXON_ID=39447 /ORGANISM="" /LENGTH=282 /DNA_ID=CAMNT_0005375353 /DNA_START=93 /DNA_END=941 /DNA_ORIENTATION=-
MSMQLAPVPFCLCFVQFSIATLMSFTACRFSAGVLPVGGEWRVLSKTSFTYTAGFICTNLAFSLAGAPFVETVKSSEPITTVILAFGLLGEVDSLMTYAMLLPIMAGVAMASMSDMTFSWLGLLVVQASNIGFSARAVYAKQLTKGFPKSGSARSNFELFYHISRLGLLLIVPALTLDVAPLRASISADKFSPVALLATMSFNGIFYTLYNLFSFMVLSRVSTSTHAVLNVFRRVVVICATTIFFGAPVTAYNSMGIVVAVAGVLAFTRAKQAQTSAIRKIA